MIRAMSTVEICDIATLFGHHFGAEVQNLTRLWLTIEIRDPQRGKLDETLSIQVNIDMALLFPIHQRQHFSHLSVEQTDWQFLTLL